MKDRLEHHQTEAFLNQRYTEVITNTEVVCRSYGIDHRFVGGILPDLLDLPSIEAACIDPENRVLYLPVHKPPQMLRSDGTVKDLDMIVFTPRIEDYSQVRQELRHQAHEAKQQGIPHPQVSMEPARYPHWPKRNQLFQFVSSIDIDQNNQLYLTFDRIKQPISWQSVESWQAVMSDGTSFSILNPYAHALRYFMRTPGGVKQKDRESILLPQPQIPGLETQKSRYFTNKMHMLMKLAAKTYQTGLEYGIDYKSEEYYGPWKEFIVTMLKHPDWRTSLKGKLAKAFWEGPGTALAHGKGLFGFLSVLNDRMAG